MTPEEKAEAYDKALKKAKEFYNDEQVRVGMTPIELEKIFPELAENKDEKIIKALIRYHKTTVVIDGIKGKEIVSWLEKIGKHLKFCKTIQIGDRVTRNEGGVLVNMSQLDRIAKPRKVQSDLLAYDNQNLAWSEKIKGLNELEIYILSLVPDRSLDSIKVDAKNIRHIINKEQTPAWSEEDEKMFEYALDMIEWYIGKNESKSRLVSGWLKSIKERYTWKPTKNQIDALFAATYLKALRNTLDKDSVKQLEELYNQLKTL